MNGDQVADVLIEGVVHPSIVDELLSFGSQVCG